MLIKRKHLDGLADGRFQLAFRCWKRPTVKAGGSLRTVIGVFAIDAVEVVARAKLSAEDARMAGFESRKNLLDAYPARPGCKLYRIELHLAGPDGRKQLRQQAKLSRAELDAVRAQLARYDKASRQGAWTTRTLRLIAKHPSTLAADLAQRAGWEKAWFKNNVRKLKELGLTESLAQGYRLAPRGQAYMRAEVP